MADLDIISDWSLVLLYDLVCSLTPKGQNGRIRPSKDFEILSRMVVFK